jgi:hypothetical protein
MRNSQNHERIILRENHSENMLKFAETTILNNHLHPSPTPCPQEAESHGVTPKPKGNHIKRVKCGNDSRTADKK